MVTLRRNDLSAIHDYCIKYDFDRTHTTCLNDVSKHLDRNHAGTGRACKLTIDRLKLVYVAVRQEC